jgi:hypothetical protein
MKTVRQLRCRAIIASATAAALLLGINGGVVGASSSTFALKIGAYAVATATHDQPAHVVNAADLSNAFETFSTPLTYHNGLVFNLGEVVGYPRFVELVNTVTYKDTCLDFPDRIAANPTIAPCPLPAIAMFSGESNVLTVGRRAIAAAALHGAAVSGADVVAADVGPHLKMESTPNFAAGQGGMVKFEFNVRVNQTPISYSLCLKLPQTAYGLSHLVAC